MKRIETSEIQPHEIEHSARVREFAPECTLFLKYSGVLPIAPCTVALYGNGARNTVKGGKGSGDVYAREVISVEAGLERAGFEIASKKWLDAYYKKSQDDYNDFVNKVRAKAKETGESLFQLYLNTEQPLCELPIKEKCGGNLCLYILSRDSSEGSDRRFCKGDFFLTDIEVKNIKFLSTHYDKFCLVLNVGAPVDLSPVLDSVKEILLLSQTGAVIGDILADIVMGESYPSGKLTATWAKAEDYPFINEFAAQNDSFYNEGIFVGYRYFDSFKKEPLFPFGFGLGYTTFSVSTKSFGADENIVKLVVQVTNTGKRKGKEVVQVYVSSPNGKLIKPFQELCAYQKSDELEVGQSQVMELCFPTSDMASFDEEKGEYILEQGTYIVRVGNSSRHTEIAGALELDQTVTVSRCHRLNFDTNGLTEIAPTEYSVEKIQKTVTLRHEKFMNASAKPTVVATDKKISSLSVKELAYMVVGQHPEVGESKSIIGNASQTVAGGAGETCGRIAGITSIVMADGPAGLRLNTEYGLDEDGKVISQGMIPKDLQALDPERFQLKEFKGQKYYQYCTALPVGTALAQSWNENLIYSCGDIVGAEMELFGVQLWLAPALNIQRSPLCGRNFEYYSEDPLVSGRCAAAMTKGVQKHQGCGVTIKHFCCNNQETNRDHSNSVVSERALREIYLKGFEICIKSSTPVSVMSSYNLVNGEHTANSTKLLHTVLREEWGYENLVMTDWFATGGLKANDQKYDYASDAGCIEAGNDLIMPGIPVNVENIMQAFENGELKLQSLQECASRVLKMVDCLKL